MFILVAAYLGRLRQRAAKRLCVCVCVTVLEQLLIFILSQQLCTRVCREFFYNK